MISTVTPCSRVIFARFVKKQEQRSGEKVARKAFVGSGRAPGGLAQIMIISRALRRRECCQTVDEDWEGEGRSTMAIEGTARQPRLSQKPMKTNGPGDRENDRPRLWRLGILLTRIALEGR